MSERRVLAIVQARMGSSRLPGKVLLKAAGKTLLEHLIERLREAKTLHEIVIATTALGADDPIIEEANRLGIACFRGDEDDVLARFEGAAEAHPADVLVRITADCPLLDPHIVDATVLAFLSTSPPVDYAANLSPKERKIPLGMSVEVMTRAALHRAFVEGHDRYHREHVTPYLYEDPSRFSTLVLHPSEDLSHLRLTVDTPEDFSVVREVLEAIEGEPDRLSIASILRFFEARPEVALRNAAIKQKRYDEAAAEPKVMGLVLLVRVDASQAIGAGHAMRCFAIAEAWRKAGGKVLCVGELPASLASRYATLGAEVRPLAQGIQNDSLEDAALVAEIAQNEGANVILLDGYGFDRRYLEALRHRGRVLAYVDDFVQQDLPVDVVIDPNAGAPEGARGKGLIVCAGSAFTPLRSEIASAEPPVRTFQTEPRRLLLTFGASDPARLTLPALRAALALAEKAPLSITVLAGPMHPEIEALEGLVRANASVVTLVRDAREVAALFASIDVAFAAAGSTCWELARMGVPMLLVAVAENQSVVIDPLCKAGVARAFALAEASNEASLKAAIEALVRADAAMLQTMSEAARRMVDGKGASRITRTLSIMATQRAKETKESA